MFESSWADLWNGLVESIICLIIFYILSKETKEGINHLKIAIHDIGLQQCINVTCQQQCRDEHWQ